MEQMQFIRKLPEPMEIKQEIPLKEEFRKLKEKRDQETCYRVHRSVIVQFNYIVQIKNNIITMEDGQKIQISRMKAKKFHEKFSDYMGVKYRREK